MENNLDECVKYFKKMTGFRRFMFILKDKYVKIGKITGVVNIKNISYEEKCDLGKFFGETLEEGQNVAFSVSKFRKIMSKTKFGDIPPYNIVLRYFGVNELVTKREKKEKMENEYNDYLNSVLSELKYQELVDYLINSLSERKKTVSKFIRRKYNVDKDELTKLLFDIDSLLLNIPSSPMSIPMYASITGNPHFLNFNTSTGMLFMKILAGIKGKTVLNLEDKLSLLESINVYNDTLSNSTLTYNLKGNSLLESISELGPFSINLDNLSKISYLSAIHDKVFIFENPSILNYFKGRDVTIIITSGIPNLSFYRLIEKFDSKTMFYYNGDFDPEGLIIANKLKHVIPKLELFCYSEVDYNRTNPNVLIDGSRLHKLEGIDVGELAVVRDAIATKRMAGYQENNLKRIERFMECVLGDVK